MPIAVRRGRAVAEPRARILRFDRPPVSAVDPSSATNDPRHELARLALDVVVRTAEPVDLPRRWTGLAFRREVERTRAQLAPIRSRDALAASYSREASIAATRTGTEPAPLDIPPGPVRVAYGIRWLELGDRRLRPAWEAIVAGVALDVSEAVSRSCASTEFDTAS
jgi:hypothetical protein